MTNWEVEWTGAWPCLCYGEWIVRKDGEEIDLVATGCPFIEVDEYEYKDQPVRQIHGLPAHTHGTYSHWHFEGDWEEVWEDYEDGLYIDQWIAEYQNWLEKIDPNGEDWEQIYKKFNKVDYRYGECGGCV